MANTKIRPSMPRARKTTRKKLSKRKALGRGMKALLEPANATTPGNDGGFSSLLRSELASGFISSLLRNPAIASSELNPTAEKIVELGVACADELRRSVGAAPVSALERELVDVLRKHCGERGDNEGAVDTLKRIIAEREKLTDFEADPEKVKLFAEPVTVIVGDATIERLRAGEDVELEGAILIPDSLLKNAAAAKDAPRIPMPSTTPSTFA